MGLQRLRRGRRRYNPENGACAEGDAYADRSLCRCRSRYPSTPAVNVDILPPAGIDNVRPPALPGMDAKQLRTLAQSIMDSGQKGLVDWISSPTTDRQKAVTEMMKTLAETSGVELRNEAMKLRLAIAQQLAKGEYRDDDDRLTLIEVLKVI